MRCRIPIALALLALCAAGCLPVPSLYPLIEEGKSVAVREIVGEWGDTATTFRFELEGGTRYTMTSPDSGDSSFHFHVLFARFGGRLFADMVVDAESMPDGNQMPFLWPMHVIYRVDVAGDSLRLAFLDDKWLGDALERHQVRVRHEEPESGIVLTEKTAGLQAMVGRLANVDAAFDTSAKFMRRR